MPDLEGQIPMEEVNIFDKVSEYTDIPVTMQQDGHKITVGKATVTKEGDYVRVAMDLKNDTPDEVVEFLKGGITGVSIDDHGSLTGVDVEDMVPDHEITIPEAEAVFEHEPHAHKPVPHRDGKPPWCDTCGLTTGYLKPLAPGWFGKPALPIHRSNNGER
jgi:hypothetical protein